MAEKITLADLDGFTGSDQFYRAGLPLLIFTEGIKFLVDKAQAYWLIDLVASYQPQLAKKPMLQDFQIWRIDLKNGGAVVTCRADTHAKPEVSQEIEYTDFPDTLNGLEWYVERSGERRWTMLLKSEH